MGKTTKLKEQLLSESENELLLKSFLYKMGIFMGEEYASCILAINYDLSESLKSFSDTFKEADITSDEIAFILIKNSLLSGYNNYYSEEVKDRINMGEFQELLSLVKDNNGFKKSLTKTIINNGRQTDKDLFNNLDNKEQVIRQLDNLKFYEEVVKTKTEEVKSRNYVR